MSLGSERHLKLREFQDNKIDFWGVSYGFFTLFWESRKCPSDPRDTSSYVEFRTLLRWVF